MLERVVVETEGAGWLVIQHTTAGLPETPDAATNWDELPDVVAVYQLAERRTDDWTHAWIGDAEKLMTGEAQPLQELVVAVWAENVIHVDVKLLCSATPVPRAVWVA